jgi:hypothetical protein
MDSVQKRLTQTACLAGVLGLSAMLAPAVATAKTVNVTADTVNINAQTINIQSGTVNTASPMTAQGMAAQYKHPWWINGGIGLTTGASSDSPTDFGFNVSLNFQPTKHQLLTFRSAGADFIGGDYYDYALMYGAISRNPNGYVSATTGISAVSFNKSALIAENVTSSSAIGLPLEVQAFWTPVPNFGVGVIGYGNINDQRSFYGMVLAIQLANLTPL